MHNKQLCRTVTVLPVADLAQAVAWYEQTLGLETIYLHEGSTLDEATNYAILARDGVEVHLILDEPLPDAPVWTRAGTGYLYLFVRDIDAEYADVLARGATVARGLATENWGARGFNLTDSSGNAVHLEQER